MNSTAVSIQTRDLYGMARILHGQLRGFSGTLTCATPGIEFLLPPYPAVEIEAQGNKVAVNSKRFMAFNGWISHRETFEDAHFDVQSVLIQPEYVERVCQSAGLQPRNLFLRSHELAPSVNIGKELWLLSTHAKNGVELSSLSVDCLLTRILIRFLLNQEHLQKDSILDAWDTGYFPGHVGRIKEVLWANLHDPALTLDQLASEAGISKFHLIRIFQAETDRSPSEFLRQLRIDFAKRRLLETDDSVLSICLELGYGDLSTFNKSFKKNTSFTPTGFRRHYRNFFRA